MLSKTYKREKKPKEYKEAIRICAEKSKEEKRKQKLEKRDKRKQEARLRRVEKRPPFITCYTDGSWSPVTRVGGWCAYLECGGKSAVISGSTMDTTISRMEITAVLEALKVITVASRFMVHSDSQYVVNSIGKGWIYKWAQNGWKTSTGETVANQDLWLQMLDILRFHAEVKMVWVKGHNGIQGNELCNEIAQIQMKKLHRQALRGTLSA